MVVLAQVWNPPVLTWVKTCPPLSAVGLGLVGCREPIPSSPKTFEPQWDVPRADLSELELTGHEDRGATADRRAAPQRDRLVIGEQAPAVGPLIGRDGTRMVAARADLSNAEIARHRHGDAAGRLRPVAELSPAVEAPAVAGSVGLTPS